MAYIGKSPTAAPLTSSDVADGIITNAKLAQDIISADTALGATPADTDEFLVSDAGVLKRMDYSHIKAGGAWNLLQTITASSDSTISFTSNIDSTYDEYVFKFINIHPSANDGLFQFNLSSDSGSNYNVTKTTTFLRTIQYENNSGAGVEYVAGNDLAQVSGVQVLTHAALGNDANQSVSGSLHLFGLSNTAHIKHFIATTNHGAADDSSSWANIAGYANTASAIDAVQFSMSSGNIDTGKIKLYGIS